jgi:hypothetical protein
MIDGLIGLLLGLFGGLALRPVLDSYVTWRAARQLHDEDVARTVADR